MDKDDSHLPVSPSNPQGKGDDTPDPSTSSHKLGDTQPFRPAKQYRPLASETPLEEPLHQQTAPFKPIRKEGDAPKKGIGGLTGIMGLVALLLVAGAVGAYFILRWTSGDGGGSVAVERALPANTLAYLSINPAPAESQRRAFEKLRDAFEAQPGFNEAIASLVQQAQGALGGMGLSSGNSTDPATLDTLANYLGGNVTIAVLSPSRGDLLSLKASGAEISPMAAFDVAARNIVGLVDLDFTSTGSQRGIIADLRAAKDNLDKARVVENYNGTDIREYTAGSVHIYFSLLDRTSTAAVGISTVPIKKVIDEIKANKGLKEDEGYKYLSGKVPGERMATLYANLGEIDKSIKAVFPDYGSIPTIGDVEISGYLLNLNGEILLTLSGQDDGVQLDLATQGFAFNWNSWGVVPGLLFTNGGGASLRLDNGIVNDIPEDSLAFLAGSDFKNSATSLLDSMQKNDPGTTAFFEKSLRVNTGLDLRNDILAWMSGDYAISLPIYGTQPILGPPFTVVQLTLTEAERAKATQVISDGVEKLSSDTTRPVNITDGVLYSINLTGSAETLIGTAKDRAMLVQNQNVDAAKAMAESVLSNLGKGFGTTDKWTAISGHLPPNSNLIGYVDATALREMYERAMDSSMIDSARVAYDKDVAPLLKPLKYALAGSATEPTKEGEMSRNLTRIFIGISK